MTTPVRQSISLPNTRAPSPPTATLAPPEPLPMQRPSLSTSVSDFALPASTCPPPTSSPISGIQLAPLAPSSPCKDDSYSIVQRIRRPTYLKGTLLSDAIRCHSPLTSSFSIPPANSNVEEATDSDGDRMMTDKSPSSNSDVQTPPLAEAFLVEENDKRKHYLSRKSRSSSPSTPLKSVAAFSDYSDQSPRSRKRRPSFPVKPPRLLTLRKEARPEEVEVESEALFQRLLASYADMQFGLGQNKTGRPASDRGRYPEEAGNDEEVQREETPSDEEIDDDASVAAGPKMTTESTNITRPVTPAASIMDGMFDELGTPSELSVFNAMMDIDYMSMHDSPRSFPTPPNLWRQTPPPMTSAVRTNKRKHDDRYDPYAPATKRRAVSPSISILRDVHALVPPITIPRSPVQKSRASFSQSNSTSSSPIIGQLQPSYLFGSPSQSNSLPNNFPQPSQSAHFRNGSSSSIPHASPTLRPIPRLAKRTFANMEEVEGAGEGVGSLTLS